MDDDPTARLSANRDGRELGADAEEQIARFRRWIGEAMKPPEREGEESQVLAMDREAMKSQDQMWTLVVDREAMKPPNPSEQVLLSDPKGSNRYLDCVGIYTTRLRCSRRYFSTVIQ